MNKTLKTIFIIILLTFGLKLISKHYRNTDTILGRISTIINKDNFIKVYTKGLDDKELEITWYTDFSRPIVVYKFSKNRSKIRHEYGVNRFQIIYHGNIISEPFHFKTNNWHSHEYLFDIEKNKSMIYIKFNAIGPNENEFTDTIKYN